VTWNKANEQEKRRKERATALNSQNLPTEPTRIGYINALVSYKLDNAVVAKHPPREDRRASRRNSGKASASENQATTVAKKH